MFSLVFSKTMNDLFSRFTRKKQGAASLPSHNADRSSATFPAAGKPAGQQLYKPLNAYAMSTGSIVTAYRFDDFVPRFNATVHCFKTLNDLLHFARPQGTAFSSVRFWKITGKVVRDEGGPDGWVIRVINAKEIRRELY